MTYKERKQQVCDNCYRRIACAYLSRELEDKCEYLQSFMEGWELGQKDTIEWLEEHLWEYDQYSSIQIGRSKEKEEIMERLVANFLLTKNALIRLLSEEKMEPEDYLDAMEHLTENTIEIVVKACGTKYVKEYDWLMKEYDKNCNIPEQK